MKTTKEMIEVMLAYEAGVAIQYCYNKVEWDDWAMEADPSWNWQNYDYRIKPKPRVAREWVLLVSPSRGVGAAWPAEANKGYDICQVGLEKVVVREVLPDEGAT